MSDLLLRRVREVLQAARADAASEAAHDRLGAALERVDEPLRVALVGRVKAGKSTLLNALVGQQVAPTDAGECTRVVTWYRSGPTVSTVVHGRDGTSAQRRFDRRDGALQVDLGRPVDEVDRVEVTLPSPRLRTLTLVDTPGLASLSTEVSDRTLRFLGVEDDRAGAADAVIYLLRHVHASDLRFLEAVTGDDLVQSTPINTLGVLSRADEIGSCRLDAMDVAQHVARRYSNDARLRRTCPVVLPLAGLLAFGAESLHEDEYRVLARVATAPYDDVVDLLLTADGWAAGATTIPVTAVERRYLLDRLGLYGLRLAVQLVRQGVAGDSGELARELSGRSGIRELRSMLAVQFLSRASVLKARSALATLDEVLREGGCQDTFRWTTELESVRAGAHEFEELRQLHLLRSGRVTGKAETLAELDRLLGGEGHTGRVRLGLPPESTEAEQRAAGYAALTRCRSLAEHVLAARELRRAAAAAARSCEGVLFALDAVPERPTQPTGR